MDFQSFKSVSPPVSSKLHKLPEATNEVIQSTESKDKKLSAEDLHKKDNRNERQRCHFDGCRTKLRLIDMHQECRCQNRYCSKHRLPESHKCTYDYGKIDVEEFCRKAGLGGGGVAKVNKI